MQKNKVEQQTVAYGIRLRLADAGRRRDVRFPLDEPSIWSEKAKNETDFRIHPTLVTSFHCLRLHPTNMSPNTKMVKKRPAAQPAIPPQLQGHYRRQAHRYQRLFVPLTEPGWWAQRWPSQSL